MDIRIHKKIFSQIKIKSGIDPNKISFASVVLSIIAAYYIFKSNIEAAVFVLFFVLVLDFLDGAIARGNEKREKDPVADWTSDRLSESVIFLPLGPTGLILISLNIALSICFSKNKLIILPLRQLLFVYLLAFLLIM